LNGLADAFGKSRVPLYDLNVTYPLVDAEFIRFCAGKKAILIVEEGQPEFIEQAVHTMLRRADIQTKVHGKDILPMAGEYTGGVMKDGFGKFVALYEPASAVSGGAPPEGDNRRKAAMAALDGQADLVLSDMAPNTTGHGPTDHLRIMDLAALALDFAVKVLAPGGGFVAKVFQGGSEKAMLERLRQNFTEVRHAKPPASRKESSELYVVATGFRR
jgi:23S rRNA U2552 (ribose-2'-O)-methylase RlmE/FtsJ